jgi:hypothetical protein
MTKMIYPHNRFTFTAALWAALVVAMLGLAGLASAHSVPAYTRYDPAAVDPSTLTCILPIFDPALSVGRGKLSAADLQVEMTKLRHEVGENGGTVRVGFSGIYQGIEPLRTLCRLAKQNNLSVGVIIAVQTHTGGVWFDANSDLRKVQWRLDGKTVNGVQGSARDWNVPTPSRYCDSVHDSAMNRVRVDAAGIRQVVVVNCAIEEELAGGGEASDDQLADYSPFAVTEFRDWLRHTGMYDDKSGLYKGQGAPEAIVGNFAHIAGRLRSPFYSDPSPDVSSGNHPTFNRWFGTKFTTWQLRNWDLGKFPNAITDPSFSPAPADELRGSIGGGFDAPRKRDVADPFWNAWSWDVLDHNGAYPPGNPAHPAFGFRQVEVKHFVGDVIAAAADTGIPNAMLYAHQIPAEAVSPSRLRSGGDPIWTGWYEPGNTLGITRFGPIDPAKLTQYCDNWGIFEWHPAPNVAPDDAHLYATAMTDLNAYTAHGAHVLFPGWWQANGENNPTFPLNDSQFARALKDWVASHHR